MKSWKYVLPVFFAGCCYGVLSTFVKFAYDAGFSTAEVTGAQFFFGTILIWIAVIFTKKQRLNLSQVSKLLLSGIPTGLTGVFYYLSLQTLDASISIVFLFQFVWMGTIVEWIIYKKKPNKGNFIAIAILLIGSILAAGMDLKEGVDLPWQGVIWGLLSALSYTVFIFLSSTVEKNTPPVLKTAILSTGGLIVVMILFPPIFLFKLHVLIDLAPYGLLLGLFGVALPPLLFLIGLSYIGIGLGSILSSSELPVAVILSSLVLGEHVSLFQWIGVVLIFCGIIVGNSMTSKEIKVNRESAT